MIALIVAAAPAGCGQSEPGASLKPPEATDIEAFKSGLRRAGIWSGGQPHLFEGAGRNTLATMIEFGLMPTDEVLDVGAGALRVGWWLLHYVEPENYHAIEPVRTRIDTAARMIGADINVYYNDDFEFPDVKFDFVIARSIWTHASKRMIAKMLSEFAENSTPESKFLTSVLLARSEREDYQGDQWIGKVEQTDDPGVVRHSLDWIRAEAARNGLTVEVKGDLYDQTWVLIGVRPQRATD